MGGDIGSDPGGFRCCGRCGLGSGDGIRADILGRAHVEVFAAHPPCTTMVEVGSLIAPDMLIEVEANAVVADAVVANAVVAP